MLSPLPRCIDSRPLPSVTLRRFVTMTDVSGEDALAPLVSRAQRGEGDAVNRLITELRPRVFRYVLARLLDPHAADDVTQEVVMTTVSSLPRYVDQGRSVTAWVFGIAANKVSEARRSASRLHETAANSMPDVVGDAPDPEHTAMRLDTARRISELLDALPPPQGEILRLRIAAGLSAEETASVLGMTPGAVRVAQHRALAKLRSSHAADVLA